MLLYQMVETGTGNAAYYADILYAVTVLAVTAPAGPPRSTASFLQRLDAAWLESAWGSYPDQAGQVRAAARHLGDIQLRYATLLGRLGKALDGPGTLDEADAWYFILEGTREPSVAEAQALALTELAARAATTPAGPQRAILLAADDYSAVSRRVPLSNLYERGRSLGIGVQVSAQTGGARGGKTPHPFPFRHSILGIHNGPRKPFVEVQQNGLLAGVSVVCSHLLLVWAAFVYSLRGVVAVGDWDGCSEWRGEWRSG